MSDYLDGFVDGFVVTETIESDLDRQRRIWAGDDPAQMIALLKEPDEAKLRAWIDACRNEAKRLKQFPHRHHDIDLQQAVAYWANTEPSHISRKFRRSILRCLFPPPYLHGERVPCPECGGLGGPRHEYPTAGNDCRKCQGTGSITLPFALDPRWLTRNVMSLARVIRGDAPRKSYVADEIHSFSYWNNSGGVAIRSDAIRVGDRIDLELGEPQAKYRYKRYWYGLLVTSATDYQGINRVQFTVDEQSGSPVEPPNPERMPILADALMDAGCDSEELLRHCQETIHVSGCWVVDLILGGSSPRKEVSDGMATSRLY